MASRKNSNMGEDQNNDKSQSKSGRKKCLAQEDLNTMLETFGPMGITSSFIYQIAQAHNFDVMETGNYLLAYADRLPKNEQKRRRRPQRGGKQQDIRNESKSPAASPPQQPKQKSFSQLLQGPDLVKFTGSNPSKGAIKKVPTKSSGELAFERVVNEINTGNKVLVLLRGLPGSGKTHLAKLIFDRTVKSYDCTTPEYHIFSTDAFFEWLGNGVYKFNSKRLAEAHEWNRNRFQEALKRGISPVIVDNTNTQAWEMHPYIIEGMKFNYQLEVLEPFTPWAFKKYELYQRNVHNVPKSSIDAMFERYERHVTNTGLLLSCLGLNYSNFKPQPRHFPKLEEESDTSSSSCSDNDSLELTSNKFSYLCTIFPKLTSDELDKILQTGSTNPVRDFLNSDGHTLPQEPFNQEETQIRRYSREELLNILPLEERNRVVQLLDGVREQRTRKERKSKSVEETEPTNNDMIDWTGEAISWNGDGESRTKIDDERKLSLLDDDDIIFDNSPGAINLNGIEGGSNSLIKVDPEEKSPDVDCEAAQISSNGNEADPSTMGEKKEVRSFSSLKNFFKFFNPDTKTPPQSPVLPVEEPLKISTQTASTTTSTHYFTILDKQIILSDPSCYTLSTRSRDISEGCTNVPADPCPPRTLKLDKSSMTHEDNFLDEASQNRSLNDDSTHLEQLVTMFPKIRKNFVREIFDKCNSDLDWAVDLLLDISDNEEEESEEEDIVASEPPPEKIADVEMVGQETVVYASKKFGAQQPLSEDALKVKKQVEEQFQFDNSHYSEHCLKIRRLRHGDVSSGEDKDNKSIVEETSINDNDSDAEETESNETEDSLEDDECLEMTLGFDFVNRLDSIFGKENSEYPEGLQPVIQVPKAIARQLHLLWLESYYQQVCAHEERWEQMLKEDEEFARKLQEQENEMSASGNQPQVPTIQEILNMEIDLEIAKRGVDTTESYEDLASRLTKQKLYEMFPENDRETINDVLAFKGRYNETVSYLMQVFGSQGDGGDAKGGVFDEENLSNQEKQLIEQAKQASVQVVENEHRPMIVVREACYASPSRQSASKFGDAEYYREIGQQELRLRNECLEKARDMYLRGLTSAAVYYSELAQVHKNKYEQANQSAAIYFVNSHSQTHNNTATLLDLHYLYVAEALQVLDLFVDNHISQLKENNKKSVTLNLITGRGVRSAGGRARIKPAVLRRLKQRNLRYHFINPGLLKFKLSHYDVMTHSLK